MSNLSVYLPNLQIHNWAADLTDGRTPSLEFVSMGDCYTVIDGKQEKLDVTTVRRRDTAVIMENQLRLVLLMCFL